MVSQDTIGLCKFYSAHFITLLYFWRLILFIIKCGRQLCLFLCSWTHLVLRSTCSYICGLLFILSLVYNNVVRIWKTKDLIFLLKCEMLMERYQKYSFLCIRSTFSSLQTMLFYCLKRNFVKDGYEFLFFKV